MSTTNGGNTTTAPDETTHQQTAPGMNVLAQYIKDFSFENPNSPQSLQQREDAPALNIQVNVKANPLTQTEFEVMLILQAKAGEGKDVMFNVEVTYAGIFRIHNVPEEHMHAFVLIECPRLLFPFARQIIAEATRNGGFPPLMIDPIDFATLYRTNQPQNQAAGKA